MTLLKTWTYCHIRNNWNERTLWWKKAAQHKLINWRYFMCWSAAFRRFAAISSTYMKRRPKILFHCQNHLWTSRANSSLLKRLKWFKCESNSVDTNNNNEWQFVKSIVWLCFPFRESIWLGTQNRERENLCMCELYVINGIEYEMKRV